MKTMKKSLAVVLALVLGVMLVVPALADEPVPYYTGCPQCGERIIVTKTLLRSEPTGCRDRCPIDSRYNCELVINHYVYVEQCASGHIFRTWTDTETVQDHSLHR